MGPMSANTRDPYENPADYQPKGRLVALLLLVVALGGAGFLFWRTRNAAEPTRILVAIDLNGQWWQGSAPAAKASDEIADWLRELGFDPVRAGDPAVTAALEKAASPVEAARSLKAGYVIQAKFEPKVIEHPIDEGYFETRAEGIVQIVHVGESGPATEIPVQGWSGAKSKERALEGLGTSVALRTFDAALVALASHPKLEAFFQENPRNVPPERLQQLKRAREFVAGRSRALEAAASAYKSAGPNRIAKERGAVEVTYHGTMADDDALCGAGPEGVLVRTSPETPFMSPATGKLGRIPGLEGLEWRKPDGQKKALWTGYNVYGYPAAAPEGTPVVLVEDLFGGAKTVTVVGAGGEPKRLKLDPVHRFSTPVVAPGGGAVALEDRGCYSGCPTDLLVLSLADGQELFRAGPEGGAFGGHAWLDARRLVVLHDPKGVAAETEEAAPEGQANAAKEPAATAAAQGPKRFDAPRQTLWLVDLGNPGASPVALLTVGEGESLSWLRGGRGGKRLAAAHRGPKGRGLAVINVEGGNAATMTVHDVSGDASAPVFSPDDQRIAFNLVPNGADDDEEIAVISAAGGAVTRLTDNPFRDRYPQFSHDGARIFFESLDRDPAFPLDRNVSVIASVPAAP